MLKLGNPPNSRHQQDLVLSVPQFLYHPPVFKASSSNLPILGVPVIETSKLSKVAFIKNKYST